MAAMAPALTDAPAEAHHIRFKLAPPSSTLSPDSTENSGNAGSILISSNGTVKHKTTVTVAEECSLDFRASGNNCKDEQQHTSDTPATPLGKLQPLVASYLCSDVTSVPSTKESLKLQGVLIKQSVLKTQSINSYLTSGDFLSRKQQTLESCGDQFKSLMSSSGVGGQPVAAPPPQAPVNGLAKKVAKANTDKDCVPSVNGGRPLVIQDSTLWTPQKGSPDFTQGDLAGPVLLRGCVEGQQQATGLCNMSGSLEQVVAPASSSAGMNTGSPEGHLAPMCLDANPRAVPLTDGEGAVCSSSDVCTSSKNPQQELGIGSLDDDLSERMLLSQSRQGEIEGRLRRLRKRLQVVQAKQVERHVQQQLGGLVQISFSKLPSLDVLRQRSPAVLTRKAEAALWRAASDPAAEDGLGRFLRSGTVPAELEHLALSGTANLHAAESAFDSDATESSSGGETDVEEDELTKVDLDQCHIPLWRRAEGRYAVERASIISHWNWLQAQISDLEYRIRQQTDIYRHIRTNKGLIELAENSPCEVSEDRIQPRGQFDQPVTCHLSQDAGLEVTESMVSTHSPVTDPGLWKGCGPGRQVNGIINSLHPNPQGCVPPQTEDPHEQLARKLPLTPLLPPLDSSCIAARTRPVLSYKKRRLVQPGTVANLNRKIQRSSGPRCSCDVNPPCVMCGSRPRPSLSPEFPYERPLLERLSQFDPCIHPILSFSDDVSMNLHLQRVLKSHWQDKSLERIRPLKKLSLKHKLSLGGRIPDSSSTSASSTKEKHKLCNSLLASIRFHKFRPEKLHRQQLDSLVSVSRPEGRALCKPERTQGISLGPFDRNHSRKRPREHSMERSDMTPRLFTDTGSPCSSLASLHTPTHSPLTRQLSTSSEGSTPLALSSQSATSTPQPVRRRRGESSFDINNIVIPMSVAATTRVEKLQYKEILTPSWREVDISAHPIAEEDENVEIEDLSDAAFAQLHLPCEEQERSRWTWMASAPAKRRGSRSYKSLDGRTTPLLGGTNPSTPQPASPDTPHFHALQDYGPVPSPHSPASPDLLSNLYTPCSRDSHRLQSSEDTRCSTPDFTFEELTVQPWERRTFPLPEDPPVEPEEPAGTDCERPARGFRRISGSRLNSSKSECENGPASPFPDEGGKQKFPVYR
ncbi:KAT8 regulatory NSL complex subunit 1 isoform X1 [Scleropages formosus]|uniref:KAT8 regulatory NSL complex subunit 1 n=1 Tax=Scleropages formosus TaxID=113540 RepID=A0A8C9RCP5_SCLFO|nr:KAT8 regulatory NSL complex subunit 1 isoform X1 [Scleropages formosus]XP_029106085.1 KAT8 regulatory NSL complex subunit 1 isoform X1 [Scleropages formosus]XP_029106086.1 KAT8 regulatory NSL complex subunit 1 isoform X1 [Scleropages formosus]XP_029106087.1 KAT8 regulatory NSL complex subunit 1 isoform X1 [Scleropages formosus]XP_029106088.1 KAT8 regulatory NSL complex subunit 1 isoform X1 [Scleropages formosus]